MLCDISGINIDSNDFNNNIGIADPEWYHKYFEHQLEATRNYCEDDKDCEEFDISQLDPLKWKVLEYLSPAP